MSNRQTIITLNITYANAGGIKEIYESIIYDLNTLVETYGEIGIAIKMQIRHNNIADDIINHMATMNIDS